MYAPMTGHETLLGSAVQQHQHAELAGIAKQDRIGRTLLRERRAARLAAWRRLLTRAHRRQPVAQPS